jgi:hypothetical protein
MPPFNSQNLDPESCLGSGCIDRIAHLLAAGLWRYLRPTGPCPSSLRENVGNYFDTGLELGQHAVLSVTPRVNDSENPREETT